MICTYVIARFKVTIESEEFVLLLFDSHVPKTKKEYSEIKSRQTKCYWYFFFHDKLQVRYICDM